MQASQKLLADLVVICGSEHGQEIQVVLSQYAIRMMRREKALSLDYQVPQFLTAKRADGLSEKTIQNYIYVMQSFGKVISLPVTQIDTEDVRMYIRELTDKRKMKITSVQMHINTLRSFFSYLSIEGIIKDNPMAKIKSFKIDKKHARHSLPPEDVERVRNACITPLEKALFEFYISTGCRLSEPVGLSIKNINFADRSVTVFGKGSKFRTIYFSVRAKLMIEEYLTSRKAGSALFASRRKPYGPLQDCSIRKIFRQIGDRAGLSYHLHPHLLRHTFATHALNSGMAIEVIQQLLGHEDLSTTQIYAELSTATVQHQYNKYMG